MRCYFNFAILILIISVIRVYPFEITCPFCIDSLVDFESKDDFYKRSMESVIYSFNDCLEELKLKNTTVPGGPSCSLVICYHTVEETKEYRKKGHIYWLHSLIDTGMSYSSDHYKFRYTKSNCLFEDEYKSFQQEFNFLNYANVINAFNIINNDLFFIVSSEKELNEVLIVEKKDDIEWVKNRTYISYCDPYFGISNESLLKWFFDDIEKLENNIKIAEIEYQNNLNKSYVYQGKIEKIYEQVFDWCIKHHGSIGTYYQRGLLNFNNGNIIDSLNDIEKIINKSKNLKELEFTIFLLKGQVEVELGLYHEAIVTLSEAIKKNPNNKKVYIDRAQAYFEIGKFDLAIKDFILSEIKITPIEDKNISCLEFSKGIIGGIIKGGKKGAIEFVPSALASLHGLGHGLWAFASQPIECSKEMVVACQNCIKFVKENTSIDMMKELVPELKILVNDWNEISDVQKGDLIGFVIGKYGIDILMTSGSIKAVKCFRDLKKANTILTLEKSAKTAKNSEIILKEASQRYAQREAVLKRANLKIQWDKQGKHIENHRNYVKEKRKSLLTHKDPQKLINKHAGTGLKSNREIIGQPGYAEIVDFGEVIGYDIDRNTGEKLKTTWGKIHYAKDGVHIVPTKPRITNE